MIYQAIQYVAQGDLPSPDKLTQLKAQRVTHLLNVSGIDLYQLYGTEQLAGFTVEQFTFKDVFSTGVAIQSESPHEVDCALYCSQTNAAERLAFFYAVRCLMAWLKNKSLIYVFCQQGIGRSPCVVCAALSCCYQPQPQQLLKTLTFLNPNALLTRNSYAAVNWFQQQIELT